MFVESKVCYSALFTNLVGWHASTVSFPLSDIILASQPAPLSDVMFCLHSGITNLSLYKHWVLKVVGVKVYLTQDQKLKTHAVNTCSDVTGGKKIILLILKSYKKLLHLNVSNSLTNRFVNINQQLALYRIMVFMNRSCLQNGLKHFLI